MAVFVAAMALVWKEIFGNMEGGELIKWVLITHVVAWIFQFIGHGVF
jgi:uncharacterized membrane protein YGL010W